MALSKSVRAMSSIPARIPLNAIRRLPGFLRGAFAKALLYRYGNALVLDPDNFRGRRVLILGPARTLTDDMRDIDVAQYDLIVRMNNGLDTAISCLGSNPLRCDLLFHSLTDEARPVTPSMLAVAGVRWLVHRTPTKAAFLDTLIAFRRFGPEVAVTHIPYQVYEDLHETLDASPTTGLVCCRFFLQAPVEKVAIVGFSFFMTHYLRGYDDTVDSDAAAVARIVARQHHKPSREAALMHHLVEQARQHDISVVLGRSVEQVMKDCIRDGE